MESKTNAMRMLDKAGIRYIYHEYPHPDGAVDGETVAASLGKPAYAVFKTLVTQAQSNRFYVFVVPVCGELDLKRAAAAVGEKSVSMLAVADLLKTTGYVRGGCSPVGMKKQFVTVFDISAQEQPTICVSAGRIGGQLEVAPADLVKASNAKYAPIVQKQN